MDLTYANYLQDEGLREEIERRAHRERADEMHRFIADSARALFGAHSRPEDACHSCASR